MEIISTNRHDYFIEAIESTLVTVTGLTILNEFDLDKWSILEMPYCYVELSPEILNYPYENSYDFDGDQDIAVWIAIETNEDGDIRKTFSSLTNTIEKAFKKVSYSNLNTSFEKCSIDSCKITNVYPVNNFGANKFLYLLTFKIKYTHSWK
jgi:hypothetical protein